MVGTTGYAVRQRPASLFKQQLCDINVEMAPSVFHPKTALKDIARVDPKTSYQVHRVGNVLCIVAGDDINIRSL
jgi:hypothetical protein